MLSPARRMIESRQGGRVIMDGRDIIMLGSNDYLGLSTNADVISQTAEALKQYGTGNCLYPLFATTPLHDDLCGGLADYLGTQDVALFSSGGSANAGALATLAGEGDVIFSDRLNHASIIDGCRLSRAGVVAYANRDVTDLRAKLETTDCTGNRLIVTDGIFSMEGGAAPLVEIHRLAQEFDAILMIDEAHATGVVGPEGAGTAPLLGLPNGASGIVLTGSLSKALGGASGGFAAGTHATIDRLRSASRSWIFTMGMTTANAASALAALRMCQQRPALRQRLWDNVAMFRRLLAGHGIAHLGSDSAITAVPVGDETRVARLPGDLFDAGLYATCVQYPVVERGAARLRLQVCAAIPAKSWGWL